MCIRDSLSVLPEEAVPAICRAGSMVADTVHRDGQNLRQRRSHGAWSAGHGAGLRFACGSLGITSFLQRLSLIHIFSSLIKFQFWNAITVLLRLEYRIYSVRVVTSHRTTMRTPLPYRISVSYTHLDVYKRQVLPKSPGHFEPAKAKS